MATSERLETDAYAAMLRGAYREAAGLLIAAAEGARDAARARRLVTLAARAHALAVRRDTRDTDRPTQETS